MTGIADREWEMMLDRIDLDVSDAELAAAEQQLAQLAPEEVAPVRAEWLEATVAKVRAEAAERAAAVSPAPVHKLSLLRRLQRFAAAAAAVVGIHSFATAATVAGVGVVAVTAVVIWKAGVFSTKTMPWRMALEIQLRADQPEADRTIAMFQVFKRVKAAVSAVQRVRDDKLSSMALVDAARSAVGMFDRQLSEPAGGIDSDIADTFEKCLGVVVDATAAEPVRLQHLNTLRTLTSTSIAGILAMPMLSDGLRAEREVALGKLQDQLRQ